MTALPRYTEYKESGVEWIGEIPAHWGISALKRVAKTNPSSVSSNQLIDEEEDVPFVPMERVSQDGVVDVSVSRPYREVKSGFTRFQHDDVLIAKITPCFENGKGGIVPPMVAPIGFGSTEFHVLRAEQGVDARFLDRYVRSSLFRTVGEENMEGSAGQKRVPTDFVRSCPIPLPPLDEQRAIANYLDEKDEQITRFIESRKRMIALLEEKKQAVINQAVTKGLDPDVPIKDSGVEWLGEIPAHWEVRPLGSQLLERRQLNTDETVTQVLSLLRERGVIPYEEKGNIGNKASEDISRYKIVEVGDIVMNSMNVIIGSVGMSSLRGCLSPVYYVLHTRSTAEITTEFASLAFSNPSFHRSLVRIGNGILAHRMRIPWEKLRLELLPIPPQEEQVEILSWVDDFIGKTDGLIRKYAIEIEAFNEYRTRLVSDAVTGRRE